MKKRFLIAVMVFCILGIYTHVMAQYGVDDSGVVIDNAVQAEAEKAPPDTPVDGIGFRLAQIHRTFLDAVASATDGMGSALTGSFRGAAIPALAVALGFLFIRLIMGYANDEPRKILVLLVLAAFISNIVFSPGQYESWVAGPIIGTINSLGNFLVGKATGGQAGDIIQALANGSDKVMAACVKLDRIDSWWPNKLLAALFAIIGLSVSYLMVMVTFMLISLMTWFAIYLLKVFGAVFLFLAIFPATRPLFWAWLRAICTHGMVIVFASLILGVCLKIMLPNLEILAAQDYGSVHPLLNSATYTCIAINVMSWCMLLRAPDLAASLTGGSAGNTAGIAGVVSMTAGAVYGGAQWMVAKRAATPGGFLGQHVTDSPGGGALGALGRGLGRAMSGRSSSERKGIDNTMY